MTRRDTVAAYQSRGCFCGDVRISIKARTHAATMGSGLFYCLVRGLQPLLFHWPIIEKRSRISADSLRMGLSPTMTRQNPVMVWSGQDVQAWPGKSRWVREFRGSLDSLGSKCSRREQTCDKSLGMGSEDPNTKTPVCSEIERGK
jgi:hypothetical protein